MANSNDLLVDALTRHQLFIQRYAVGRERQAMDAIDRIMATIEGRLVNNLSELSKARLDTLLLDLRQLSNGLYQGMADDIVSELSEFTNYEVGFTKRMLTASTTAEIDLPSAEQIQSSIYSNVMKLEPTKNYSIGAVLQQFTQKKALQITQTISDGVILGDTTPSIIASLRSMFGLQKSQASTLARTITNFIAIQAREAVYNENKDIFDGYEWIATLDSRTSLICASRDGLVYSFGNNPVMNPKPPAHFSCRSTIAPVVLPEFNLFDTSKTKRPSKGSSGTKQVPASTNYGQWLKGQSQSFQAEVLGKTKAQLFREGNLSLGQFVDQSGRSLTLDELRELEPMTFD
jgi:SPP1 gp7 family putative phage head morphogenesis protein|tara:strand:- start:418 stop:1455 length:1038 start_codon:yes stop_codon:yes gene_type:complete